MKPLDNVIPFSKATLLLFLGIGVFLVMIGVSSHMRHMKFIEKTSVTEGVVRDINQRTRTYRSDGDEKTKVYYEYLINYSDANGGRHVLRETASYSSAYSIGDKLEVHYLPQSPSEGTLGHEDGIVVLLLPLAGIILIAATLFFYFINVVKMAMRNRFDRNAIPEYVMIKDVEKKVFVRETKGPETMYRLILDKQYAGTNYVSCYLNFDPSQYIGKMAKLSISPYNPAKYAVDIIELENLGAPIRF